MCTTRKENPTKSLTPQYQNMVDSDEKMQSNKPLLSVLVIAMITEMQILTVQDEFVGNIDLEKLLKRGDFGWIFGRKCE